MANKQPAVTEQTKANLKAAFWSLYQEKSLSEISVKQITDRAGYNRGTFYLYYRDIYDLCEQVETEVLEVIAHLIEQISGLEGPQRLESTISSLAGMAQTYKPYMKVLLGDRGNPSFKTRFKELAWPFMRQNAIGERTFAPREERILKESYLAALIASITAWLDEEDPLPIEEFIAFVMSTLFDARAEA